MDESEQLQELIQKARKIVEGLSDKYPEPVVQSKPWSEGFLLGAALYPDAIPVSECYETLVPPASIQLMNRAESSELMDALGVLYDVAILKVIEKDVDELLYYHERAAVESVYDAESDFNQWVVGISMSMIWLRDAWEDILKQLEELPDLVSEFRTAQSVLLFFKDRESGDLIAEELAKENEEPSDRDELTASFLKMVPWAVATLVECFDLFQPMEKEQEDVGPKRNDPCPCGSGKKFKKCCLQESG